MRKATTEPKALDKIGTPELWRIEDKLKKTCVWNIVKPLLAFQDSYDVNTTQVAKELREQLKRGDLRHDERQQICDVAEFLEGQRTDLGKAL